ncbi:MAG: iron-containing alcohol dehydrogenase [Methanobrevibacter sp.]
MDKTRFTVPRDIYVGENSLENLKNLEGKKAFIVIGGGSLKRFGFLDKVMDYLHEAGFETKLFEGVKSDPSVDTVMEGAKQMLEFEPDWIVAMGGGSPIDAAKAMWIFYEYPDLTFEEACVPFGLPKMRNKAKFCAIGSTSGTGTEVTAFSVITDYNTGIKWPIADFEVTPDVAIVDPQLPATMPKKLVAHTGMDALTHAIEAYTAATHQPFADAMALDAIRLILENLKASFDGDMDAREMMHYAQCEAGIAFSNGLLGIVHSMAHKTGAAFSTGHIPHGEANAIYLPYATRFNARKDPSRYAAIGRYLGWEGSDEELVEELCNTVAEFNRYLGIPHDLREFGIKEDEFNDKVKQIAENAMGDACTAANPREMTAELFEKLLHNIYYGIDEIDF